VGDEMEWMKCLWKIPQNDLNREKINLRNHCFRPIVIPETTTWVLRGMDEKSHYHNGTEYHPSLTMSKKKKGEL
jgi:hypothetical protein